MKVLLVGGSGMVGTFITPYLEEHHDLRVLDLAEPRHRGVEFVKGSVTDPAAIEKAVAGVDAFIWLVMQSPQGGAITDQDVKVIRENYEVNCLGLHTFLWLAQGAALERRRVNGTYGPHHRLWYGLGWLLVFRSLRRQLGMARVREALSGAAPIAPQVLEFLRSIGIPVREGYGMTENTAVATVTPADDIRIGTVGKPLPGSEVRIADDGEILTRSDGTFLGYFKNPEATAATVVDGWLHTGDVGFMDEDGHLHITDRKKDIIITAGGKNISPSEIENRLKVSPYVREAIVVGDRRKFLTALVGIEGDTVGDWATRQRVPYTTYEDLASKPEVRDLIDKVVAETNVEFAQVETVKRFELLPIELDHEDGQLTATQKVKRSAIAEQFSDLIEGMYR